MKKNLVIAVNPRFIADALRILEALQYARRAHYLSPEFGKSLDLDEVPLDFEPLTMITNDLDLESDDHEFLRKNLDRLSDFEKIFLELSLDELMMITRLTLSYLAHAHEARGLFDRFKRPMPAGSTYEADANGREFGVLHALYRAIDATWQAVRITSAAECSTFTRVNLD